MTNVRLSASRLLSEGRPLIPNLRGLKFSHNDLLELQDCVNAEGGTFDVLFGFDEFLLAGLCWASAGRSAARITSRVGTT